MTNEEIKNITLESLRDWFKKEKWVRISSSGNIAGDCGTSKNKKNPDRCLPKAKAQSLSKAQRAATARKKKKAGAKGKTVVKNTKAAKVTRENNDRSFTKDDVLVYVDETIGGYLERYLGYNPGPPNHPMYKMTPKQMSAYIAQQFMDGIDGLLDETDATIEVIREGIEEAYEEYKKISMGIGHDPDMHFEPEEEKIGADALGMVLTALDKLATPTKLETANPQDGKAAPYGSGYKTIKKMKKENLVFKELMTKEKLLRLMKNSDDAMIQTRHGREFVVYSPYSDNKDNAEMWGPTSVIALDDDGAEHEVEYKDIDSVDVYDVDETKEAPAGHYFTKSGNLVKGTMTKDAKERGARKSDPKDKMRSKVPPVSQTREDVRNLVVGLMHEMKNESPIQEKDDRCTRLAKQKYDTWPSAYASGAVVRCRRGEIWKKK